MAFPYDPNATNAAMSKLGYDYQLPTTTSITPSAATGTTAPMAAKPATPPATVATSAAPTAATPPPATNDPGAPAGETSKPEGGQSGVQQANSLVQGITQIGGADEKQNQAMKKVGALVGTILSAYTGNAAGVAGGVGAMKNAQQE